MISIPCNFEEAFLILDWFDSTDYRCPDDYDMYYDVSTSTFQIYCTSPNLETLLYLKFG